MNYFFVFSYNDWYRSLIDFWIDFPRVSVKILAGCSQFFHIRIGASSCPSLLFKKFIKHFFLDGISKSNIITLHQYLTFHPFPEMWYTIWTFSGHSLKIPLVCSFFCVSFFYHSTMRKDVCHPHHLFGRSVRFSMEKHPQCSIVQLE